MKEQDLVIKDFQKGIADSPYLGFADMRNVDVITKPGIAQIGYLTSKVSSTTVTGLVKWFVQDPTTGNLYALDDTGKLYRSTTNGSTWTHISGNTTTDAHGNGLAVWKSHVFVARDTKLDVLKISDNTWYNDWQTLTSDILFHPMLVAQDDFLYIGCGNVIASVADDFAAGTPPTGTFTSSALDLPSHYRIKCLAELGNKIFIGTWVASGTKKIADIFPWDPSEDTFNLPLRLAENGINQIINYSNNLYINAGLYGTLYKSNGYQVVPLKYLKSVTYDSTEYLTTYPGAIMHHNNKIMFGVSTSGGGNPEPMGIFGLFNDEVITFDNSVSTLSVGATNTLIVGSLFSISANIFAIGWQDNATYGIDVVIAPDGPRYTSYAARIDSPIYQVGTVLQPKTFSQIEFQLTKPLTTGQGIKLSYRTNTNDSFTLIGTFDYATYAGIQAYNTAFSCTCNTIQIRVELTTGAASTTTPELLDIRLR